MSARSSITIRAFACLAAALVLGAGAVGLAAATAGTATAETDADARDDSLATVTDETTDRLADAVSGTTGVLDETVDRTTDTLENATDGTTDTLENATDVDGTEGTATDGLADGVNESVDETTDALDGATGETTDSVENATDETTDAIDETVANATGLVGIDQFGVRGAVGVESDASNATVGVDLEFAAGTDDAAGESDGEDADEAADDEDEESGAGGSTGTDAVLVGLLGAITASGAAAGGAGASAGSAAAGNAGGLVANWTGHVPGGRHLRRAGSVLPWKLLPIFKYSRYDDSDPLENDRRRAVYETIAADPGCYLSQVSERSDVALSTVRHHVRVLEEEGLVTSAKVGGKRRYYLEAGGDRSAPETDVADAELHAALAEPAKREVLETLAALGTAHNGRLADELDRDPSTVSHHLSALEDDGLVVREKEGRSVVNELAPDVEATLRDGDASLEDEAAEPSASAPADD